MKSRARIWLGGSVFLVSLAFIVMLGRSLFFFHDLRPPGISNPIQPNDLLNAADPKQGKLSFKYCATCHHAEKGAPKADGRVFVGPSLFGIVGAPIASAKNFPYSDALLKHRGKYWTTDELYEFLKNPTLYAPGNYMTFEGLLDPQDRMDLIAYLITLK